MSKQSLKFKSQAGQALMTFATKMAMMALRLTRNVILARVLGVADRGAFAFLVALPDLIVSLMSAGLQTSAARLGAEAQSPGRYVVLVSSLGLVLGLIFAAMTYGAFQIPDLFKGYYDKVKPFAPYVSFVAIVFSVKFLLNQFMIGANWIAGMNLARILESILLFVFMLAFFAFGYTALDHVIISWALSYLVLAGVLVFMGLRYREVPDILNRATVADMFHFGVRGHADMIFQRILLRADYVFISSMLGAEALGFYAVAVIGAEALSAISEAANTPLTRRLLRAGDVSQFNLTMIAVRWVVLAVTFFGVLGGLMADWGVRILFGDEFAPAVPALLVLIPAQAAASGASLLRLAILGRDKPGLVSLIFGVAAAANLLLNWALIPSFGIVGAAAASSLTYAAGAIALLFFLARIYGQDWRAIFKITPQETEMVKSFIASLPIARFKKPRD